MTEFDIWQAQNVDFESSVTELKQNLKTSSNLLVDYIKACRILNTTPMSIFIKPRTVEISEEDKVKLKKSKTIYDEAWDTDSPPTTINIINYELDTATAAILSHILPGSSVKSIVFKNTKCEVKCLNHLLMSLRSLKQLQTVELDYIELTNSEEEPVESNLVDILRTLPNIELLSLRGLCLSPKEWNIFIDNIATHKNLKTLRISQANCNLDSVNALASVFRWNRSVESLSLGMCGMNDESLALLKQSLVNEILSNTEVDWHKSIMVRLQSQDGFKAKDCPIPAINSRLNAETNETENICSINTVLREIDLSLNSFSFGAVKDFISVLESRDCEKLALIQQRAESLIKEHHDVSNTSKETIRTVEAELNPLRPLLAFAHNFSREEARALKGEPEEEVLVEEKVVIVTSEECIDEENVMKKTEDGDVEDIADAEENEVEETIEVEEPEEQVQEQEDPLEKCIPTYVWRLIM
eukprot:TRINITY_DN27159_c0_g1_i2.p1 TRINITY_DN27159_c0_g1~~TRINITY_DN27159_c0_g1_i2.p1  ORF type:complete len:470 (-),score=123.48 TRINITY_DN27159_c0_g1_i2:73-1482(-)